MKSFEWKLLQGMAFAGMLVFASSVIPFISNWANNHAFLFVSICFVLGIGFSFYKNRKKSESL
jgi:hypothetical protein